MMERNLRILLFNFNALFVRPPILCILSRRIGISQVCLFSAGVLFSIFYLLSSTLFLVAKSGEWTWMKGSNTSVSNAVYGTQGVSDPANTPQGMYEPCEWRDKQGNFWLYGGDDPSYYNMGNLWKYSVATN